MLTPFPNLLVFAFFAPTLLRIAAAFILFIAARRQYSNRAHLAPHMLWGSMGLHIGIGLMLFAGYYTQIAALAGAVGVFGIILFRKHLPQVAVFPQSTLALLLVMLLSLLMTGAGAFAYDLPL